MGDVHGRNAIDLNMTDAYPISLPPSSNGGQPDTKEERSLGPGVPVVDPTMFTGVLGDMVHAADPTTEADPVGVYVTLLAGAGVLAGPTPHIRVGNTDHRLLIWPLLFGRTGSGRKGEAGETAATFLRSTDPGDYQAITVSGLSSGEGLIERLRDPETLGKGKHAVAVGREDKRLLVTEPEFASVMARSKRDGSTLAAVMRQAWDGKPLSVLNRTAITASASHIAILGHITPREFRLRLAEAEMAGGLYNRFLPVYVDRSKRLPMPEGIDARVVSGLSECLDKRIAGTRKIQRIKLDRCATELWSNELYDEMTLTDDTDADSAWGEFTRRSAPYCLRIAALLAALDGRSLITAADLRPAAALVRYSIASAKYVLGRQDRDPRMDRIRRAIDASPDGLTRTDLSALFSRNLARDALDALIDELLTDPKYTWVEVQTRGRPATCYRRASSG